MKDINTDSNKEYFKQIILRELDERTAVTTKVAVEEIVKNNGVVIEGFTIEYLDGEVKAFFYLNELYKQYCNGISVHALIEQMLKNSKNNLDTIYKIVDNYRDFEYIQGNIMFKIINYDKNRKMLETVPHRKFLDLAVVYYCSFDYFKNTNGNILVNEVHMKEWGIDEDKLYSCAIKNTQDKNKAKLTDMKTMLFSLVSDKKTSEVPEFPALSDVQELYDVQELFADKDAKELLVLTNEAKHLGAGTILYEDLIKNYASEFNADCYIIPSSIHEVLIVPTTDMKAEDIAELKKILKEVNDTNVGAEEILSYNLYFYDRKEDKIIIVG